MPDDQVDALMYVWRHLQAQAKQVKRVAWIGRCDGCQDVAIDTFDADRYYDARIRPCTWCVAGTVRAITEPSQEVLQAAWHLGGTDAVRTLLGDDGRKATHERHYEGSKGG